MKSAETMDEQLITLRSLPEQPPQVCIFLLQLGGPSTLAAIQPFLRALFEDVLPLPAWIRKPFARYLAWRRTPKVRPNYQTIGGGSPLLANTQQQQQALVAQLTAMGIAAQVYIVMRYTDPRCAAAVAHARTVLPKGPWLALSLYPHYSYATSRSSLREFWQSLTPAEQGQARAVCAYPTHPQFIAAVAATIMQATAQLTPEQQGQLHYVFSAHGLPLKLVQEGDPYPQHIEQTVAAVVQTCGLEPARYTLCYQSKVGRAAWLTPSTEDTITALGKQGIKHVVIVPIAFTSEHIETLHELDLELREVAEHIGITTYIRVPTISSHPAYMQCLAELVQARLTGPFCCGLVKHCEMGQVAAAKPISAAAPPQASKHAEPS